MNTNKVLGKISIFTHGIIGYNEMMLGYDIQFSLDGGSSGVGTSLGFLDYETVKHSEYCKWTEKERDDSNIKMLKEISFILKQAKVKNIEELVGIPVEVTLKGNTFESWRVPTEVL